MKAWWAEYDRHNFGDWLTPYIIRRLTGALPEHSNQGPHLVLAGSILQEINADSTVIGAGFGASDQKVNTRDAKILAVRGPLSAKMLVAQGYSGRWLYGDPGLVLPFLYPRPTSRADIDLGIFPHYLDLETAKASNHFTIDPTLHIETVLDQLFRCQRVITSSLHGLICAQVYRIPCILVSFGSPIAGDGMKYIDYMLATNQRAYTPIRVGQFGWQNLETPLVEVRPSKKLLSAILTTLRG